MPTVGLLAALIHNPTGQGDLTTLLRSTPALEATGARAFSDMVRSMNASEAQVEYLREYAPDLIAALGNVGQTSAAYDANGHYSRTQPFFGPYSVNGQNQLVPRPGSERYAGLQIDPRRPVPGRRGSAARRRHSARGPCPAACSPRPRPGHDRDPRADLRASCWSCLRSSPP